MLDQLRAILRAPNLLGDMLPPAIKLDPTLDEAKIIVAMTRLDAIRDQLFPTEQTRPPSNWPWPGATADWPCWNQGK